MCLWVCGQRESVARRCGSVVHILTGWAVINRAWRLIAQCLVWPLLIVELQPGPNALTGFGASSRICSFRRSFAGSGQNPPQRSMCDCPPVGRAEDGRPQPRMLRYPIRCKSREQHAIARPLQSERSPVKSDCQPGSGRRSARPQLQCRTVGLVRESRSRTRYAQLEPAPPAVFLSASGPYHRGLWLGDGGKKHGGAEYGVDPEYDRRIRGWFNQLGDVTGIERDHSSKVGDSSQVTTVVDPRLMRRERRPTRYWTT